MNGKPVVCRCGSDRWSYDYAFPLKCSRCGAEPVFEENRKPEPVVMDRPSPKDTPQHGKAPAVSC